VSGGCCRGIESMFGDRTARRDLERYRKRGPSRPTRRLLDALRREGVEGASLLDIGGGVGAIQHELLDAGASRATGVDASPAYLRASLEEASRRGHGDRVTGLEGDFVALAGEVPAADVVTLDRVICCYPDMHGLVGRSAGCARRSYGLVHPRDSWWTRLGFRLGNVGLRLARKEFRAYVHRVGAVDTVAEAGGLSLRLRESVGPVWQVSVYDRRAAGQAAPAAAGYGTRRSPSDVLV
jgi:SAM-dependent methyltransferase